MKTLTYHADTHTTTINECDENVLKHLQHEVNGYIECIPGENIGLPGIDLWVNDEGAVNGLPYAFSIAMSHRPVPLFGNVVFARHNGEGDTIGLNDEDIDTISEMLAA